MCARACVVALRSIVLRRSFVHSFVRSIKFQFNFISFHLISFHFISFHFISFHFISFHFISFHFISFHFISFHFIFFMSFHFISFQFNSIHFIHIPRWSVSQGGYACGRAACVRGASECARVQRALGVCVWAVVRVVTHSLFAHGDVVSKFLGGARRLPHPPLPLFHQPSEGGTYQGSWGPTARRSLRMPSPWQPQGSGPAKSRKLKGSPPGGKLMRPMPENTCQKVSPPGESLADQMIQGRTSEKSQWRLRTERCNQQPPDHDRKGFHPKRDRWQEMGQSYTFGLVAEVKSQGAGTSGRSSIAPK